MSEDPIGFSGSPDGNFFAYCGNDPVNFSDPLGLMPSDGIYRWMYTGDADASDEVYEASLDGGMNGLQTSGVAALDAGVDMGTGMMGGALGNPMGDYLNDAYYRGTNGYFGSYRCAEGYGFSKGAWTVAYMALSMAKGASGGPKCFVAGTPVTLGDGSVVPIESVKVGDTLHSRDEKTGKIEAKLVQSKSKVTAYELVTVEFADPKTGVVVESVTGTTDHPFWVPGKGWVALGELGIGTSVVTRAGPHSASTAEASSSGTLVVKSTHWRAHPEGVAVYNFIVEGFHTYFVGGDKGHGGVWVHNGTPCDPEIPKVPMRGHGNSRPWRDTVAKVQAETPRDFEAKSLEHAQEFAKEAGLSHNPGDTYGPISPNTYQIHPSGEPAKPSAPGFDGWPHLKYMGGRKGVTGHIFFPPSE